jgi:hypothetical protein
VAIFEHCMACCREKVEKNIVRKNAFLILQQILKNPPFFFTYERILSFTDTNGALLTSQYTYDDLKDYLEKGLEQSPDSPLPLLYTVTVQGETFYIHRGAMLALVSRLWTDACASIQYKLTNDWANYLRNFEQVADMQSQAEFEKTLEELVRQYSPILYAILASKFIAAIYTEALEDTSSTPPEPVLYVNGKRVTYSVLLRISRASILQKANTLLPVWYTVPFFIWLFAIIRFLKKTFNKKSANSSRVTGPIDSKPKTASTAGGAKDDIEKILETMESDLVPPGSTVDRELIAYERQWNHILDVQAHDRLTDDVNSQVKNYLKKMLAMLRGAPIDIARINGIADTLANMPSLSKITERTQLTTYIKLYIIKILNHNPIPSSKKRK